MTVKKDSTSPAVEVSFGDNTPVGSFAYAKTEKTDTVYKVPVSMKNGVAEKSKRSPK